MAVNGQQNILDEIRRHGFSFDWLAEAGQCPILQKLKEVPQNPEYHGEGDVYTHTQMLCREMIRLPLWQELAPREQELVFLAGAFHDLGKLPCTKWEDGKWTSPKHTIVGARMFRELAYREGKRFGLSFQEREQAAALIRFHGLPVWFWTKRRPEFDLHKAAQSVSLKLLYILSKADTLGRIGSEPEEMAQKVDYFWEYACELGIGETSGSFFNDYSRFQYFHKEDMDPGAQLYDSTEFDVYVMSGLPLSGKDTWIDKQGKDLPVVSLDQIREEFKISPTDGSARVVTIANRRARSLLREKKPFIWNATNIMEDIRQRLVGLFSGYGARVHFIYLEAPYGEMMRRNQERERYIPEPVLETMIGKWEPPAPWEGYSVNYVDLADNTTIENL